MEPITINANDANNQEDKKKGIDPTTIAATATTAAAGIAFGATITTITGDSREDLAEEVEVEITHSQISHENVVEEVPDDSIAEVNPDDVMLEETSPDVIYSETETLQEHLEDEYQPFANHDTIAEDVIVDDILLAENHSEDMIAEDSPVDIICGIEDNQTPDILLSENTAQEGFLDFGDSISGDIQTDLMV